METKRFEGKHKKLKSFMNQVLPQGVLNPAKEMTGKRLPMLRIAPVTIPEKEEALSKTGKMRQQQNPKKERELQARSMLNLPEGV